MSGAGGAGVAEAASSWFMATAPASEGAGPVDGPSRLDLVDGPVVALTPSADLLGAPLWHASQGADERRRFDEGHAQLDNPAPGRTGKQVLLGVIGKIENATACPARGSARSVLSCRDRFRKERGRLELGRHYLGLNDLGQKTPSYYLQPRFLGADRDVWKLGREGDERTRFNDAHDLIDRGRELGAVRLVACSRTDDKCWGRFTGERMRLELIRESRSNPAAYGPFDELGHQAVPRSRVRTLTSAPPPSAEPDVRAPAPAPAPEGASSGWMGAPMRLVRILSSSNAAPAEPTPAPLRLKLPPAAPVVSPEEVTLDDIRGLIAEANDAERAQLEELVAAMGQGQDRGWLGMLWDTLAGWFTSDDDSDTPTGVVPLLLAETAGAGPDEDAGEGVEASGGGLFDFIGRTQNKVVTVAKWAIIAAAVLGVGWLIAVAVIAPYVVPAIAGVLTTGITTGGAIGGKSLDAGTALVKGGLGGLLMGP